MLVYRICSRDEVDYILNTGSFDLIGGFGFQYKANNHHYQKVDVYYMHFFLNKDSVLYVNSSKGVFLCTYDIPNDILNKYTSLGDYLDYINYERKIKVIEFAIPSLMIKLEYLKRIDVLTSCIDYKDFLDGDLSPELYETIYDTSKLMIRKRKKEEIPS